MKKIILAVIFTFLLSTFSFAADIKDLVDKGDKACKIGNFMAAKKFYKEAIQSDPKNEDLWKKYEKSLKSLYGGGATESGGC